MAEAALPVFGFAHLLKLLAALAVTIALFGVMVVVMKKLQLGNGQPNSLIKVLAALPLGGKEKIWLLEIGGERVVVGSSAGSVVRIHVLERAVAGVDTVVSTAADSGGPPRCTKFWRHAAGLRPERAAVTMHIRPQYTARDSRLRSPQDGGATGRGNGRLGRLLCAVGALVLAVGVPEVYAAASDLTLITSQSGPNGGSSYSISLQILLLMTLLSLLPALLMSVTAFTRIVVVLAILRQALGLMQTPSNQVILGLALFTTFFIMAPVFDAAWQNGIAPYMADELAFDEALLRTGTPFHGFMTNQTREADLALFAELGGYQGFATAEEIPFKVLVPAFITSELKTAFQIGFLVFIPFLVIDLVVASVLMSMGMMMLSPMLISLPFKIMLFVLVDGWTLVMGTLATSFFVG